MNVAVLATLLLFSMAIASSAASDVGIPAGSDPGAAVAPEAADFCEEKCGARCSKAGVQDRCLKYCGICCIECGCVPSGTYGNKSECPCYMNKNNSKGKPKCP